MQINLNCLYNEKLARQRWLIIITVMLVAMLEVLDSTIINVSLPAMMASLGANQNQITWVLTTYVVAAAIVCPLTGFLTQRFGEKNLLLICIIGFMLASFLCGASQTLTEIIFFRFIQGVCGASLIPLSQASLRNNYPLAEQGKAMAIWGIGIMAAPVFGPSLGGFITEHASWRWVFYINLPICLAGCLLTAMIIKDSPTKSQKIDWFGLGLMAVGIGSLQIFLDKGNENDWLNSHSMLALLILSIYSLTYFIARSVRHKTPVIKLAIFKNRNFTLCSLALLIYCGALFSMIMLQPIMLENLFGYSSITTGLTMAPLGLASAAAMIITSVAMRKINIKYILLTSILLCMSGMYHFSHLNLQTSMSTFLWTNALLGFGMGSFMAPISMYSLATISKPDITEASGLFSYARMLGTSVGISLLSTLVARLNQVNWQHLVSHVTPYSQTVKNWFAVQHLPFADPVGTAHLSQEVLRQASMMSYLMSYKVIELAFLLLVPLILGLKSVKFNADISAH